MPNYFAGASANETLKSFAMRDFLRETALRVRTPLLRAESSLDTKVVSLSLASFSSLA